MFKRLGWLVVLVVLLSAVPALAQDSDGGVLAAAVALSVGELIAIGIGVVALIVGVSSAVATWGRGPERTWSGLDQGLAYQFQSRRSDTEFMQAIEKLVDGMSRQHREALKDVSATVLAAAQWIPGTADDEAARLFAEGVDGVPIATKLAELEARVAAYEKVNVAYELTKPER